MARSYFRGKHSMLIWMYMIEFGIREVNSVTFFLIFFLTNKLLKYDSEAQQQAGMGSRNFEIVQNFLVGREKTEGQLGERE